MWTILPLQEGSLQLSGDCGSSLDVSSSHFGTFDFAELEQVQYDLEISGSPIPERDGDSNSNSREADELLLVSRHGQKYSCQLPKRTKMEEEGDEKGLDFKKLPNVTELLQPLKCLTKTMGWWTYEYCHGQFIRQYHLEAGKWVGKTLYLGFFDSESQWDQEHTSKLKGIIDAMKGNVDGVPVAYHSALYVNGTKCDLTGKPRMAVVRMYCSPGASTAKLVGIQEKETCNYTLTIQTPLLCSHPLLDPSSGSKPHLLSCAPLLSQEEYQKHLEEEELRKQQEKEVQEIASSLQAQKKPPEKSLPGYDSGILHDHLTETLMKLLTETNEEQLAPEKGSKLEHKDPLTSKPTAGIKGKRGTEDTNKAPKTSSLKEAHRTDADPAEVDQSKTVTSLSGSQDLDGDDDLDIDEDEEDEDMESYREELESAFAKVLLSLLNEVEKAVQLEQKSKTAPSNAIPKSFSDESETPESDDRSVHSSVADQMTERLSKLKGDKVTIGKVQLKSPFGKQKTEVESKQKERTEHVVGKGSRTESPSLKRTAGEASSDFNAYHERQKTVKKRDKSKLSSESDDATETETDDYSTDEEGDAVDEQEWDEEMLRELEREVQDVLREELSEAGLQDQAEIKVKILSTSKKKDDGFLSSEKLLDDLDQEELHMRERDAVTNAQIVEASSNLVESMTKLLEELLTQGDDGSVSEERLKQRNLESNYDQVWHDREQRKQDKKQR